MPEKLMKRIPLLIMTLLLTMSVSSAYLSFIKIEVSLIPLLLIGLLAVGVVELLTWNKWTVATGGVLCLLHLIFSLAKIPVFHDLAMSVNACAWDTYLKVFWTDRTLFVNEWGTVCIILFVICLSIHVLYTKRRSVVLSAIVLMVYIFFMEFYDVASMAQTMLNLFLMLVALVVLYGYRWHSSGETRHKKKISLQYGTPVLCVVLILSLLISGVVDKTPNKDFRNWLDRQFSGLPVTDLENIKLPAFQQSVFEKRDGALGGDISFDNRHLFSITTYGTSDAVFFENSVYLRGVACDYFENDAWKTAIDDGKERLLTEYFYKNLYFCGDGRDSFVQNALDEELGFYQQRWLDVSYDTVSSDAIFNHTLTTNIAAFSDSDFGTEVQDVYYDNSTYTYHKGNVNWYEVEYIELDRNSAALQEFIANAAATTYNSSAIDENLKQQVQTYYLQMPENMSDSVTSLAERLTDGCANDYEKAVAIESYLQSNYTYTLKPGDVPEGKNLVEYFLFESQKGYCVYYASSMVMLCRSIGIPARYVKGYRADGIGDMETVSVKDSDSHAWVEVLLPNLGWVTFDPVSSSDFGQNGQQNPNGGVSASPGRPSPTPTQNRPTPTMTQNGTSPTPETATPETEASPTLTPTGETPTVTPIPTTATDPNHDAVMGWILRIGGLLILLCVAFLLWKRYNLTRKKADGVKNLQNAALRVYKRMVCVYTFLDQAPEVGETVAQYLERLDNPDLTAMRDVLDACFYHQGIMKKEQYKICMTALRKVEDRAMKEKGKLKWKWFRWKFRRNQLKDKP